MRHKQLHFNFSCFQHSEVYQQFVFVLLRVVNATSERDVKHARREFISIVIDINVDGCSQEFDRQSVFCSLFECCKFNNLLIFDYSANSVRLFRFLVAASDINCDLTIEVFLPFGELQIATKKRFSFINLLKIELKILHCQLS